jgi:uncharacterized protein
VRDGDHDDGEELIRTMAAAAASVEKFGRRFIVGDGVTCDLDTLINTRLLVQANSGAGKSWALRRLLEQTHGHVQHLVIDPEGEFASLRERFDYVLAARSGGDTAADPRTAKLLAERLLELGASAILDIYELKPHERVRFVRLFLDALVDAPKHLWHPALVVLDEAHVYCPEQGDAESADAVKGLCTRGRKRGFCAVLATQRLSKLHKDAAAECNNKLIGRSALDVDMKRAADELGLSDKSSRLQLRDLSNGEFFAFGPALSRQVTRVHVGTVQTTHPKAGSHLAAVVPPPTDKVRAMLPKLADLPAEAEEREKSVEALKRDNAQLRRQLTEAQKVQPRTEVQRVEVPVLTPAMLNDVRQAVAPLMTSLSVIGDAITKAQHTQPPVKARVESVQVVTPRPVARRVEPSGEKVAGGERKILTVLAQYPEGRSKSQVALLAGYAVTGGGFNNYLGALRSKGWIVGGGDQMRMTDEGLAALGSYDPLPSGADLLNHWLRQLGKAERLILQALADVYPRALSKDALGAATGYEPSGGGFNNALGRLRTLELIEGRGEVKASDVLFE